MTQLTLLTLEEIPRPTPAWECTHRGLGKHRRDLHAASGWWIEHCGHATAIFPYVAYDPDGRGHVNPNNGRGFRHLVDAKQYVEETLKKGGIDA